MNGIKITCFLFFLIFTSCKINEAPTFIKIENLSLIRSTSKHIILGGEALFNNPNLVGGKLVIKGIDVSLNQVKLGKVESEDFKVPIMDKFTVPFRVTVPLSDIHKVEKGKLMEGIINSFLKKTINLRFKGDIIYKLLDFSTNYHVDEEKEVKIIL